MKFRPQILALLLVASCNRAPEPAPEPAPRNDAPKITECVVLKANAYRMDSVLLQQIEIDTASAYAAIKAFADFAYYCDSDSAAPVFLIKTAQVANAVNNVPQAKTALDRCINDYPDFPGRPAAMFLLAQLYDEQTHMNNEYEAQKIYQGIIDSYPKSVWAENARAALKLIGKSDEEILKQFKTKKK